MNYEQEEDSIINYLVSSFVADAEENDYNAGKIDVSALPEVDEEFDKSFGKRKIYVAYTGEEADQELKSLPTVNQEGTAIFSVLIKSKSLRTKDRLPGSYALIRLLKKFLIGFQLDYGYPLVFVDAKMESHESGIFTHVLNFRSKIYVLQDQQEEEPVLGGKLNKVNYL